MCICRTQSTATTLSLPRLHIIRESMSSGSLYFNFLLEKPVSIIIITTNHGKRIFSFAAFHYYRQQCINNVGKWGRAILFSGSPFRQSTRSIDEHARMISAPDRARSSVGPAVFVYSARVPIVALTTYPQGKPPKIHPEKESKCSRLFSNRKRTTPIKSFLNRPPLPDFIKRLASSDNTCCW